MDLFKTLFFLIIGFLILNSVIGKKCPSKNQSIENFDNDLSCATCVAKVTDNPIGCKDCYSLIPSGAGASQFNYDVSTDCPGVLPDQVSGRCGNVKAFDREDMAVKDNYYKSTPEVINLQVNNRIPNHLISQVQLTPVQENEILPSNELVKESPCDFVSERTNLSQYFKGNPDLFLNTNKWSTFVPYVPYTYEWQEKSDCYNNRLYELDTSAPLNFLVNKI